MKTEHSYQDQWNEMVFENRNKDYGAFLIRKIYLKNVIVGLIATNIAILFLVLLPSILSYFHKPPELIKDYNKVIYTELTSPPPIQKNKLKRLSQSSPEVVNKFLEPNVTRNKVQEDVKNIAEIKINESENKNAKGEDGDIDGLIKGEGGKDYILDMAEQMPEYPGGLQAMSAFIANNIRYPLAAQRKHLSGVVFVSFVVNTDGTIDEIFTTKGFFEDCDKEAERVVSIMPLWEPGRQEGKTVKVRFVLPIKFKLGNIMSMKKSNHTLLQ